MTITCAIIGSGFSGTILTAQLIKQSREFLFLLPLKIFLIEKHSFARGAAYSTESPNHILNVPAEYMSAFADSPKHFLEWAKKVDGRIGPSTFVSRRLYGQYLEAGLEEAFQDQTETCSFEKISGEVISLDKEEGYLLTFKDGRTLLADWVVLATGNYPPAQVPLKDRSFRQSPKYFNNPWVSPKTTPQDAKILIIGTGLSMVDKVVELYSKNHQGEIHAISRRGLLPKIVRPNQQGCKAVDPIHLEGPLKILPWLKSLHRALKRNINDQDLVVYQHLGYLYKHMSELPKEELVRASRHLYRLFNAYSHQIPYESGSIIQQSIDQKKLFIHAGRLLEIQDGPRLRVTYSPRYKEGMITQDYDYVFNCLSPAKKPEDIEDPFLNDMLSKGYIRPDSHNLILDTGPFFQVIDKEGNEMDGLFAIGSIKKGLFNSTVSVPIISLQVKSLANYMLNLCKC